MKRSAGGDMSPEENKGLDEARAARERAEADLDEMIAQRPKVKEVAKSAVLLRRQNHFSELVTLAFRRAAL